MTRIQTSEIPDSLYNLAGLSSESVGTESFAKYYWHMVSDLRFIKVYNVVLQSGSMLDSEHMATMSSSNSSVSEAFEKLGGDPAFQLILLNYEVAEMLMVRTVGHMIIYLQDILFELASRGFIKVAKKENRGSKEPGELVHPGLAQKIRSEVDRISYKGFGGLVDHLHEVGIDLSLDSHERATLERIIENRNLLVHHHGIITQKYRSLVPSTTKSVGETLDLTFADVTNCVRTMLDFVGKADDSIRSQHTLPTTPTKEFIADKFLSRINGILGPALAALKED